MRRAKFTILLLSCVLVTQAPGGLFGEEVWHCAKSDSRAPFYTTAPVNSPTSACDHFSLRSTPYNKISGESFERLGAEGRNDGGMDGGTSTGKEDGPDRGLQNERAGSEKLYVTWRAKEVSATTPDRQGLSARRKSCHFKGIVRAERVEPALVVITRGGATTNSFPILTNSNLKPLNWAFELQGPCRNPNVAIRRRTR